MLKSNMVVQVDSIYSHHCLSEFAPHPSHHPSSFHLIFHLFRCQRFHSHYYQLSTSIMQLLSSVIAAAVLATNVAAHPGQSMQEMKAEMAERAAFMQSRPVGKRDLSQCSEKMKARGLEQRSIARRVAIVKDARKERGLSPGMTFYAKL
jgi:hypothetical protein